MESLWIVIPIGTREIYIENLLLKLSNFKNRIVFVNNNKRYTKFDSVHHIEDFKEINIYRWWNKGILYSKSQGAKYVAVLNDDIDFDSTFIPQLYSYLVSNNLAIVDTDNTGNGGGAAWVMDLSFGLLLNEHFRWWYGDTEIFDRAKKLKKFARIKAAGHFVHHEPNNLMYKNQVLTDMSFVDAAYYNRLNDLKTIYSKYSAGYGSGGGDKGTAHDYIGTYAKHLSNRTNIDFLEIGVFRGDSIKMWNEYFVDSSVLGIDISLDMVSYPDLKNIMICDATSENEIDSKLGEKVFDYIIDDGSHIVGDQIASFDILFKRMKRNGIYFIEDILGDANLNQLKNHVDSLGLNCMVFDTRSEHTTDNDLMLAIFKE